MPTVLACVGLLGSGVGDVSCRTAPPRYSGTTAATLQLPCGQWTLRGCTVESTLLCRAANRVPNPLAVLRSPILGFYTPRPEVRVHPKFLVGLAPIRDKPALIYSSVRGCGRPVCRPCGKLLKLLRSVMRRWTQPHSPKAERALARPRRGESNESNAHVQLVHSAFSADSALPNLRSLRFNNLPESDSDEIG